LKQFQREQPLYDKKRDLFQKKSVIFILGIPEKVKIEQGKFFDLFRHLRIFSFF
jgi:hypothetical protein